MTGNWPEIRGINSEEVRRLLQDDLELFQDVAIEFIDENAPALESAAQVLEGDDETARKRLHRLRGQASSLAATDLVAAIRVLEAILKGEQSGDRLACAEAIVGHFQDLAQNIRAAI